MPIGKSLNSSQLKSNKKLFTKAGIVLFLAIILLFPAASYQGAKKGLLLWFNTILPTLLPFIIISNLIIKLQIHKSLSKLFYPLFHLLFGVSKGGCYPILIGFLSGYPVGAKSTADLVTNGIIDEEEGQFLLSLCNNVSPMFVMSYIAIAQLDMEHIRVSLLLIIYLSSIISAMLYFKLLGKPKKQFIHTTSVEGKAAPLAGPKFDFALLDSAIMDGFEVITKVGGYIILFSIPAQILSVMSFGGGLFKILSVGFLEITTGINQLSHTNIDLNIKIALIAMVTAFGGLSGLAQTKSVISNSRLSIGTYFKVKIINMLFALLLTIFYVKFML
ncbi:MAG: putative rane protein [Lachnospiraceae bacterium]|jgi:sporulation integral membrane protein YlbJ|nr:putative rane protein [Lachnospiraceae bacterium]